MVRNLDPVRPHCPRASPTSPSRSPATRRPATSRCRSSIRCGSSTAPAPPACPRASCTPTAESCSNRSKPTPCTTTWALRPGVHRRHHRVGGVEHARRRDGHRRHHRHLRRQPHLRAVRTTCSSICAQHRVTRFGTGAAYLDPVREGRRHPRRRLRSDPHCARSCAPAPHCPTPPGAGSTDTSAPMSTSAPTAAEPMSPPDSLAPTPCTGLPRRTAGPVPRGGRPSLGLRRAPGDRSGRGDGDHRADAVDADLLLERPRRTPLPRRVLRHLPGRVAARRLDHHHRPRHAAGSTAAPTRPSTAAASGWARPTSTRPSTPSRRSPTPWSIGAELPDGGYHMPLFVVLRAGCDLDDALVDKIRSSDPHARCPRGTCPTRSSMSPPCP